MIPGIGLKKATAVFEFNDIRFINEGHNFTVYGRFSEILKLFWSKKSVHKKTRKKVVRLKNR